MAIKDKVQVPIKCPKCSKELKRSLAELERQPNIQCPSCGATITVKGASKSARALDALGGALSKLGKKRR